MINRLLKDAKALLTSEAAAAFLDELNEDAIPQNADALLLLGQYVAALKQFKIKFSDHNIVEGHRQWRVLPQ